MRTAESKLDSERCRRRPAGSQSRRTTTPSCDVSSSSLTMSCPRRALVGQCTRRSDSPCSYSRTEWKSNPAARRRSSLGDRRRQRCPRRRRGRRARRAGAGRRASPASHETGGLTDDEAEEIADHDLCCVDRDRSRAAAARDRSRPPRRRPWPRRREHRVPRRPTRSWIELEPSRMRVVRRNSSATRTRSPSVGRRGTTVERERDRRSASQVHSHVTAPREEEADADDAERDEIRRRARPPVRPRPGQTPAPERHRGTAPRRAPARPHPRRECRTRAPRARRSRGARARLGDALDVLGDDVVAAVRQPHGPSPCAAVRSPREGSRRAQGASSRACAARALRRSGRRSPRRRRHVRPRSR